MPVVANEWAVRSIKIANEGDYLDRLEKSVYPVSDANLRKISGDKIEKIVQAHNTGDAKSLVKVLLKLKKFPIEDVYVGFLRDGGAKILDNNTETVQRVGNVLLSMNIEDVIKRCRQPIVTNRQMGQLFNNWVHTLPYPFKDEDEFKASTEGICFLNVSPKKLKEYSNTLLGCGLDVEPDVLLKVNEQHVVGEAKFLSGFGGHQGTQFERALNFIQTVQGNAFRIAIIDGVPWLNLKREMCKKIRRIHHPAMTALLFEDYIKTLI